MRLGVIADVHGNLAALDAVLAAMDRHHVEGLVCAGDLVGYHPDADAVVARLDAAGAVLVAGNHDLTSTGALAVHHAWEGVRPALEKTRGALSPATRARLASLPTFRVFGDGLAVFHGHVDDPTRRAEDARDFLRNQRLVEERSRDVWLAVHGHTHVPAIHCVSGRLGERRATKLQPTGTVALPEGRGIYLNPGSVDGARRGEGVACFAVLEVVQRTVTFGRAPYEHRAVERRARRAGYRPGLGLRCRLAASRLVRRALDDARG